MYSFCYNTHSLQINAKLLGSISSSPEGTKQGLQPGLPIWIKYTPMSDCDDKDIATLTQTPTFLGQSSRVQKWKTSLKAKFLK